MALPASRRQIALDDLLGRLRFITVAGGYNSDAGKAIFLGEEPRLGPDDSPVALALSIGDDAAEARGGRIFARVPVTIWALCSVGAAQPLLVIEAILTDIKEAVEIEPDGSLERSLGELEGEPATQPKGLDRGTTRALARTPGSNFVGAGVEYILSFEETWGKGGR